MSTPQDTWALPEVKRRLLAGHHITQSDMLAATEGCAWRLSAAIHYLRHARGWGIASRTGADGCAVYWLPADEIARLRAEGVAA